MLKKIHLSYTARFLLIIVLALGMIGVKPVGPVFAATLTVTNTNDAGSGSLRDAIAGAATGDTIVFQPSLSGQTITLASTLVIDKSVTIDGYSLTSRIGISGNNQVTVIEVGQNASVTLKKLGISNGLGGPGGGIHNLGTLSVENCALLDNNAYAGGGIYNGGAYISATLTVTDSIFLDNSSGDDGGGIYNYYGVLDVSGSIFSNNSAQRGAGLAARYGTVTVNNSSFTSNVASGFGAV
jgi:hypothetical protein